MKKALLVLTFFIITTTASISAWEPNDLTKFPSCMNANDWILNLGIGLNSDWMDKVGDDGYYLPTFLFSFDKNVPLGDQKLPFFFGGLVGYTGYGYDHKDYGWHHHRMPLGFRVGYHFNWGVDNLDTYAVATVGYIIGFTDNKNYKYKTKFSDDFFTSVNIGARWFINNGFGFWAETGFGSLLNPYLSFDLGISFKF